MTHYGTYRAAMKISHLTRDQTSDTEIYFSTLLFLRTTANFYFHEKVEIKLSVAKRCEMPKMVYSADNTRVMTHSHARHQNLTRLSQLTWINNMTQGANFDLSMPSTTIKLIGTS